MTLDRKKERGKPNVFLKYSVKSMLLKQSSQRENCKFDLDESLQWSPETYRFIKPLGTAQHNNCIIIMDDVPVNKTLI